MRASEDYCMIKISVKVVPQAGRQKIILDKQGAIKCYLTSSPEDGKANRELIDLFAKLLNISRSQITIVQGLISRNKLIAIEGAYHSENDVKKAFGLSIQEKLFDENA